MDKEAISNDNNRKLYVLELLKKNVLRHRQ